MIKSTTPQFTKYCLTFPYKWVDITVDHINDEIYIVTTFQNEMYNNRIEYTNNSFALMHLNRAAGHQYDSIDVIQRIKAMIIYMDVLTRYDRKI